MVARFFKMLLAEQTQSLTHLKKHKTMKKISLLAIAALVLTLSSCQVIGDIFKAGVGVGVFMVVAVIGLIIFLIAKIGGGR